MKDDFSQQYSAIQSGSNVIDDTTSDGNSGEMIMIRITSNNLYIMIGIVIAFGILILSIGVLIGLYCCSGFELKKGFAPIPKYDYSTTDVEDVQK